MPISVSSTYPDGHDLIMYFEICTCNVPYDSNKCCRCATVIHHINCKVSQDLLQPNKKAISFQAGQRGPEQYKVCYLQGVKTAVCCLNIVCMDLCQCYPVTKPQHRKDRYLLGNACVKAKYCCTTAACVTRKRQALQPHGLVRQVHLIQSTLLVIQDSCVRLSSRPIGVVTR